MKEKKEIVEINVDKVISQDVVVMCILIFSNYISGLIVQPKMNFLYFLEFVVFNFLNVFVSILLCKEKSFKHIYLNLAIGIFQILSCYSFFFLIIFIILLIISLILIGWLFFLIKSFIEACMPAFFEALIKTFFGNISKKKVEEKKDSKEKSAKNEKK